MIVRCIGPTCCNMGRKSAISFSSRNAVFLYLKLCLFFYYYMKSNVVPVTMELWHQSREIVTQELDRELYLPMSIIWVPH